MTDLLSAFAECAMNVKPVHVARMEALGVDRALNWRGPAAWGLGKIETQEKRRFQFSDEGQLACMVPVCRDYDYLGFEDTLTDLLAFRTDQPSQWWSLLDNEPVLNPDAVEKARPCLDTDEVLIVHETPLDWLRDDRDGVVILDWSANLHFHLGGVRRIYTANPILAKRLEKALTLPTWPSPEIRCGGIKNAAA
jgi:hypothetical protein